jgi:hypothetical protein
MLSIIYFRYQINGSSVADGAMSIYLQILMLLINIMYIDIKLIIVHVFFGSKVAQAFPNPNEFLNMKKQC